MRTAGLLGFVGVGVLQGVLAGCGGGDTRAAGPVARDSAGVRIVENAAPAWREGAGWRVSDAPALEIGTEEGAPEHQLDRVRGAVRLADGRIVVANGGSRELRVYDPSGRHLATVGRQGGGPGEFIELSWLGRGRGDSLLVWDGRARRLSVFDGRGSFVRSVQPPEAELRGPRSFGVFDDGSMLTTGRAGGSRRGPLPEGESRAPVVYHLFAADGRPLGRTGPFPGTETFGVRSASGATTYNVTFGRRASVAVAGDRFYTGDGDRYEVREHTPEGKLARLIRRAHEPVPVGDADVRKFFEEQDRRDDLSSLPPGERAAFARSRQTEREQIPHRGTLPAFARLLADEEGNLWVEESRRPGDGQPRWSVFDREGRWLGVVSTPPGLEIYQIGPDWVLGMARDEMDVQHVRLYRLAKP